MNDSVAQGRILRVGTGRTVPYAGQDMHILSEPSDGFDGFSAAEVTVPAKFGGPIAHVHDGFDEAFYILDGRLLLTYGNDAPVEAEAGSLCLAPRGLRHTFSNPDSTETRVLGIWTPARVGLDFMEAIGAALPGDGSRPDPLVMAALYEAHASRLLP
jgi:mannose-6-phosphate isomerase-like protein (cupin superfamily)